MSESGIPRVMILGTGKNHNTREINSIMSSVEPVLIPADLVEGLYVTFNDERKVMVEKKHLSKGVDYRNIERTLRTLGLEKNIRLIEIVVDLDLAQDLLRERSDLILKPLFEE